MIVLLFLLFIKMITVEQNALFAFVPKILGLSVVLLKQNHMLNPHFIIFIS